MTIWASFATLGYPQIDSIKHNETWKPIESKRPYKCLDIGEDLTFIDLPETERMAVWDAIYENHNFS